jgi:hypothetical protein
MIHVPPDDCVPCEKAHALLQENHKAFNIFQEVSNQRIFCEDVSIGIDYNVVWRMIDEHRTVGEERLELFRKIQACEDVLIGYLTEKKKEEVRKIKNQGKVKKAR